jgi:transposase
MDADTLSLALQEKSAALAAQELAVTRGTIYRWCKALNIRRRQYGCPDADHLRELERSYTLQKDIARQFGVSRWTVWRWCRTLGIAHSTNGQFRKGLNRNVPSIHEEMPFGVGVEFERDEELLTF